MNKFELYLSDQSLIINFITSENLFVFSMFLAK